MQLVAQAGKNGTRGTSDERFEVRSEYALNANFLKLLGENRCASVI